MTIRLAVFADLHAIVRMALQFIATSGYRELIQPNVEQLEVLVCWLLDSGAIFIAERDGQPCGMLATKVFPHPMSGELTGGEIAWWIDPDQRGGTAALRLVAAAEQWCLERGAKRFQMVAPAGSGLGAVYERLGYEEVETAYQKPLQLEVRDVA